MLEHCHDFSGHQAVRVIWGREEVKHFDGSFLFPTIHLFVTGNYGTKWNTLMR